MINNPDRASVLIWQAPREEDGRRVDSALADAGLGLSRSQIKEHIEAGRVNCDGKAVVKTSAKVLGGAHYEIAVPPTVKLDLTPHDLKLSIVFEDKHLAVVEKPAGISVHPSDTENAPTLVHGLLHQLKTLSSIGGVARPGIVHRIDKGTSGLLVVTKTDKAHEGLARQFKEHSIERVYRALVYGDLAAKKGGSGRIETYFDRHPTHRRKMTGTVRSGRKAITHWKVLRSFDGAMTLVECRLETGRTHQIRVHLSELGFSIVGDPLYGQHARNAKTLCTKNPKAGSAAAALDHQLLHAAVLGFEHPVTKKQLRFECEPPADFAALLKLL